MSNKQLTTEHYYHICGINTFEIGIPYQHNGQEI